MSNFYILTFENTHSAINGETVLKENKISNTIMPTPTFITRSCGLSIRVAEKDFQAVRALLGEKIRTKEIYFRFEDGYKRVEQ